MDDDKILDVLKTYREHFIEEGIEPHDSPHDSKPASCDEILSHCCGMVDKMEEFVLEGRLEKTFRWLGFIQGCLWSMDQYTLDDLKNHNRPNEN